MSKLKKLRNRVLVSAIFLLSCTRLTVARILPSAWTSDKPNPTVFALSEAAWVELRAGVDFTTDDKATQKSGDDKKDATKSDDKAASKSDDKKDSSKSDDKKDSSKPDDKKDASKSDDKKEASPGGGDGEVADGVGG
jgi:nucleosome binding factor SPN SPT16 subunit